MSVSGRYGRRSAQRCLVVERLVVERLVPTPRGKRVECLEHLEQRRRARTGTRRGAATAPPPPAASARPRRPGAARPARSCPPSAAPPGLRVRAPALGRRRKARQERLPRDERRGEAKRARPEREVVADERARRAHARPVRSDEERVRVGRREPKGAEVPRRDRGRRALGRRLEERARRQRTPVGRRQPGPGVYGRGPAHRDAGRAQKVGQPLGRECARVVAPWPEASSGVAAPSSAQSTRPPSRRLRWRAVILRRRPSRLARSAAPRHPSTASGTPARVPRCDTRSACPARQIVSPATPPVTGLR